MYSLYCENMNGQCLFFFFSQSVSLCFYSTVSKQHGQLSQNVFWSADRIKCRKTNTVLLRPSENWSPHHVEMNYVHVMLWRSSIS